MTKIVTVIQARVGSTRLPGKVLKDIVGRPLLLRMVERVQRARTAGTIVIATTLEKSDDAIEDLCNQEGLLFFRGSQDDLLDRHYQAGLKFGADAVVKIPSDCPLIDPAVIDKVISFFLAGDFDYVSNLHPASYPDGNDVEVMSWGAITKAWQEAHRVIEREHTTPYFWENTDKFSIANVQWESGLNFSMSHRWTIDYPDDFEFIRSVYEQLYPRKPDFGMEDILDLTSKRPEIFELNAKFAGVNWYRNHLSELKTVAADQTKII